MIIAIANQKGGVSKTTTAAAIACALHQRGEKVLAIDADPQSSLSFILGADMNAPGLLEALKGEIRPGDEIQTTQQADILPGSRLLAAEQGKIKPGALRDLLAQRIRRYKFVIIDTAPGLTNALMLGLMAADTVIIPALADAGSLIGLRDLKDTITAAQQAGSRAKIGGVLITQANSRKTNAEKAIEGAMRATCEQLQIPVYNTQIRKADAVRAAAGFRESIVAYDPTSKPAADYIALLQEMEIIKE